MIKRKYEIPKGSLEEVTKKRLKEYFVDNDIWYKMPQPGTFGSNIGTSDFQCLHKGLFVAIEAKRNLPSAKPSVHQIQYLKDVNDNRGFGMVVKCTEDIIRLDEELRLRGVVE